MKLDIIKKEYIEKVFDNCLKQDYDKALSKFQSDFANIAKTWHFLRLNTGVNPSYTHFVHTKSSSYDGVILQNKPLGEYAERRLWKPRVNPIDPFFGRFSQTQNSKGAFTMNAVTSKETFFINIPSLGLVFTFETKADALVFADEAQAQYPEHKIERWVNRQFTDSWGEVYIVDSAKGNIHKIFTDKQKAVAYYERLAMEFADTIIYTSEWSKEAISALEGR